MFLQGLELSVGAQRREASVCIIEEDDAVRDALSALLHAYGYTVIALSDSDQLGNSIAENQVGCIVAEAGLLHDSPDGVLDDPDGTTQIPVILMTRSLKRPPTKADAAMSRTMLLKPFSPTQLLSAVCAAMHVAN